LTLNQLPSQEKNELALDVSNCNQENCGYTNRINITDVLDVNITQTWYISVYSNSSHIEEYAIWFDSVCPPRCRIRGSCTTTGPETGKCTCIAQNFYGLDCFEIDDGFTMYDLILIILAAIIGALIALALFIYFCLRPSRDATINRKFDYVEINPDAKTI